MKKILVIGHTYIAAINRAKWKTFARMYPTTHLKIIVPHKWPDVMFTHHGDDCGVDNTDNCEFVALPVKRAGNEVLYRYSIKDLKSLLCSYQPDIIHVEQGASAFSYFQVIFLAKRYCRRACFSFFTWINWKPRHSLKYKLLWKWVERFNVRFSDGALVGNHEGASLLKDQGFEGAISVSPQLGVDMNFFTPATRSVNGYTEAYNIAFIGRLEQMKGIFVLLEAFNSITSRFPQWSLKFIGDGSERQNLRTHIEDARNARITLCDAVNLEQVRNVLHKTHILVLPSLDTPDWREQFGHILIEAMSAKVPVIGSDAGEIPYVIGNGGLIVEQNNVAALADALQRLMKDVTLRTRLAQIGYQRVLRYYSHEAIARRIHEHFTTVASCRS